MAASAVSTYGVLEAKEALLMNKVTFAGSNDDTKKIALVCAEPTANGTVQYNLPAISSNANLLSSASDLDASKLDVDSLTAVTSGADTDKLIFQDASDGNAIKKMDFSDFKTYVGSSSLSAGDIDNSNLFAANVVDANALADNAVDSGAIANGSVTFDKLATAIKPSTNGQVEASKLVVADASRDVANVNELSATIVNISTSWRIRESGGDIQFEYTSNGGSTWTVKGSFTSS